MTEPQPTPFIDVAVSRPRRSELRLESFPDLDNAESRRLLLARTHGICPLAREEPAMRRARCSEYKPIPQAGLRVCTPIIVREFTSATASRKATVAGTE